MEHMKSEKPAGQRHMKKTGHMGKKNPMSARSTMGTGKAKLKGEGAMGRFQKTGDGGASKS